MHNQGESASLANMPRRTGRYSIHREKTATLLICESHVVHKPGLHMNSFVNTRQARRRKSSRVELVRKRPIECQARVKRRSQFGRACHRKQESIMQAKDSLDTFAKSCFLTYSIIIYYLLLTNGLLVEAFLRSFYTHIVLPYFTFAFSNFRPDPPILQKQQDSLKARKPGLSFRRGEHKAYMGKANSNARTSVHCTVVPVMKDVIGGNKQWTSGHVWKTDALHPQNTSMS